MYKQLEGYVKNRYHYLIHAVLTFLTMIATVVNMSLHRWYVYCFWEFGLFYASKLYDEIALHDEYTIFDVHSEDCGSVKLIFEEVCPDLCDYLDRFAGAAGGRCRA